MVPKDLGKATYTRMIVATTYLLMNSSQQVLQEVAAARRILVMCQSAEIDGTVFCQGLRTLDLTSLDSEVQSRVHSAADLMDGATLRKKYAASSPDRLSLDIQPLLALIYTF